MSLNYFGVKIFFIFVVSNLKCIGYISKNNIEYIIQENVICSS